ncbi:MAG TPA: class I SAM-dependent methyltransferase [Spirochaetia bacterium]|nr:class I SAM-dependent methyltransferase [Spirochaetia bacterium]
MKNKLYADWFKNLRDEPIPDGGMEGAVPFLKLISPKKKKVLVIGCGDGHEVSWLNQHKFEAIGITASKKEAEIGLKKYKVKVVVRDMHDLGNLGKFDAIYASNVLEHSPMPFLALLHWRNYLKKDGWLILVMPSKEWLPEHYHYSVMTRSQMKDLLHKTGFQILAGPKTKSQIDFNGGDIYYDLGRKWGFLDGYVTKICNLPKNKFLLGVKNSGVESGNPIIKAIKTVLKFPYNKARQWYAKNIREW